MCFRFYSNETNFSNCHRQYIRSGLCCSTTSHVTAVLIALCFLFVSLGTTLTSDLTENVARG